MWKVVGGYGWALVGQRAWLSELFAGAVKIILGLARVQLPAVAGWLQLPGENSTTSHTPVNLCYGSALNRRQLQLPIIRTVLLVTDLYVHQMPCQLISNLQALANLKG